jgi:hypothetical protein
MNTTLKFEAVASYLKKQSNGRIQKIIDGLYDLMDDRDNKRENKKWEALAKATKGKMSKKS